MLESVSSDGIQAFLVENGDVLQSKATALLIKLGVLEEDYVALTINCLPLVANDIAAWAPMLPHDDLGSRGARTSDIERRGRAVLVNKAFLAASRLTRTAHSLQSKRVILQKTLSTTFSVTGAKAMAAVASNKATKIDLFSLRTPQMRAFHLTWIAFFVTFYAWFATAPLMPIISDDLHFSKTDGANIAIAGVFATILARFAIGPMCDKYGPRITYTLLLALGSIPVFGIAFAWDYTSFLVFRLLIGIIGASFVITQFHTSVMFAPNVVGTANATVGGWGNAGGGVTQSVMPLIVLALAGFGLSKGVSWRYAQIVPGVLMLIVAVLYYRYTQDTPEGNFADMRKAGLSTAVGKKGGLGVMAEAGKNYRVWLLGACYGASFGVELFVHSVAVTYYFNKFHMSVESAGYAVGAFGLLALFARALGGIFSDKVAKSQGLQGRTWLLFALMMGEGIFLITFSTMNVASLAVTFMIIFGLFTHMACGSLYALVPFIDRKCLGGVCGIIGAGGNIGGVAAGFLLRGTGDMQFCFKILGCAAILCAIGAATIRFSIKKRQEEQALYDEAVAQRNASAAAGMPAMA